MIPYGEIPSIVNYSTMSSQDVLKSGLGNLDGLFGLLDPLAVPGATVTDGSLGLVFLTFLGQFSLYLANPNQGAKVPDGEDGRVPKGPIFSKFSVYPASTAF